MKNRGLKQRKINNPLGFLHELSERKTIDYRHCDLHQERKLAMLSVSPELFGKKSNT